METILPVLAAINGKDVVQSILYVVCFGVVFALLWWLVDYLKLPEPFNKVARVILAIAAVVLLINVVLGLAGHPLFTW